MKTGYSGKRNGGCGKHSEEIRTYRILVGKTGRSRACGKARRRWKNIQNELREMVRDVVYLIHLDKDKILPALQNTLMTIRVSLG